MTTGDILVGAAVVARDRLGPPLSRLHIHDWAVEAEELAGTLLGATRLVTRTTTRRTARLIRRTAVQLAEIGALEEERALNALADRVATAAVVNRMVDAQLDRVLRPLVIAVLDDVFRLLEAEPERVQSLVKGQRDSMVDDLVERVRLGAAAGDSAVNRFTARFLHRVPETAP